MSRIGPVGGTAVDDGVGRQHDSERATSPSRTFAAIGLAAFTVAAIMAFVVSRGGSLADGGFDPYGFGEMGRSVARGDGFEGFGSLIKRRAPLYPLMLGGLFWVFGERENVALFVHCLLFTGTALLVYDLGRLHFNRRSGQLAAAMCILHPLLIRYVPSLHLETLLTFLFTLMIWCSYRFYRAPTVWNGVAMGVVAGLTTLTKAVGLVYPSIFIIAIAVLALRAQRRAGGPSHWRSLPWLGFVAIGLSMTLTIAPWTIRNYNATGHFVLVSSGTSDAFLRGTIFSRWEYITLQQPPYTDAENASNEYFRELSRQAGTEWERDDYETDQILNEEAKRVLVNEPLTVVRKTVAGLFAFWYQLTSFKNSVLLLACAIGMWALAIVGWRRARREHIDVWPFMLPVLYLNISLALLLALGRYSAPVLPCLAIVAGFGADALVERWAGRRG